MSDELKKTIDDLGRAVDEFKKTNDDRLKEIEKRGTASAETEQKLARIEKDLDKLESLKRQIEDLEAMASRPNGNGKGDEFTPAQRKHMDAFEAWMRKPGDSEKAAQLSHAALEAKAVSSSTGSAGHAIPEIIGARIQETLQQESPMRSVVDVVTVGSSDYKELVDVNGEDFGWVGETTSRTATNTPALEQVAPTMGEIYAYPQVYEHILDDAFFDVGAWLIRKISRAFARGEGEAFISGNGSNKPTGFLNGSPAATGDFASPARAFGTVEYIPTGVAGALPNDMLGSPAGNPGDVFLDTIHALRPMWRQNAIWLMNTTTKGAIRKFKDVDGNYLLRQGLEAGEGDRLLGYQIREMDHMPDVGSNTFPIAFGNFREAYLAVERTALRITIDDNISSPGSVKFYVRKRIGGKLRQDQAIKLIKAAAS